MVQVVQSCKFLLFISRKNSFLVYLLKTLRKHKAGKNEKLKDRKFLRFYSRRHFFHCHKLVSRFISCFLKRREKIIYKFHESQQKTLFKKNILNFRLRIFCASDDSFINSFPRNRACVWKVALASEKHVLCCLMVFAHIQFRGKNCNKN